MQPCSSLACDKVIVVLDFCTVLPLQALCLTAIDEWKAAYKSSESDALCTACVYTRQRGCCSRCSTLKELEHLQGACDI